MRERGPLGSVPRAPTTDPETDAGPWQRWELLFLVLLTAFVCATRAPLFLPRGTAWDEYQYALAVEDYDVLRHRPHPPGYPLFVVAAKAVHLVVPDSLRAVQVTSTLFSAGGLIACYALARLMYGPAVALIAALLLATSNVFWQQGTLALSYTAEACAATVVIWACYRTRRQGRGWLLPTLLYAAAGGIRQGLLVFLAPAYLYALWRLPRRSWLYVLPTLALAIALWIVGLLYFSDSSWAEYRAGSTALYTTVLWHSSIFNALHQGAPAALLAASRLARAVAISLFARGVLLATIPLAFELAHWFRPPGVRSDPRRVLLLLWAAPPLLFCLTVHMPNAGYALVYLPCLLILAARGTVRLTDRYFPARPGAAGAALASACVLANLLMFFWSLPAHGTWVRELDRKIRYIEAHFDPTDTIIVTSGWGYRPAMYYLRDFQVYWLQVLNLRPDIPANRTQTCPSRYGREQLRGFWVATNRPPKPIVLGPEIRHVVFFGHRTHVLAGPAQIRNVPVGPGLALGVADLPPRRTLLRYDRLRVWFEPAS